MRHCLVMADKVAKLPSLVNNLITNQGVTLFTPYLLLFTLFTTPIYPIYQHGTNDFLGQILARGEGITRTSMPSCKWGIIPKKALIRMGDWCGFIIRN